MIISSHSRQQVSTPTYSYTIKKTQRKRKTPTHSCTITHSQVQTRNEGTRECRQLIPILLTAHSLPWRETEGTLSYSCALLFLYTKIYSHSRRRESSYLETHSYIQTRKEGAHEYRQLLLIPFTAIEENRKRSLILLYTLVPLYENTLSFKKPRKYSCILLYERNYTQT